MDVLRDGTGEINGSEWHKGRLRRLAN